MTEKYFGDIIEDKVEGFAKKVDKLIEEKMERKCARVFTRLISVLTSLGLIVGARFLINKGHIITGRICMIIGISALFFEILRIVIFKRD